MRKWRCVIFIILVFLLGKGLFAQEIKRFRHVTVNEGLAHTDATCFTQDANGFMWIGTNSGLQRFDGQQLELFSNTTSTLNQVYNDRITSLEADGDKIWVGTENGLHLFDLLTESFVPVKLEYKLKNKPEGSISKIVSFNSQVIFLQSGTLYTFLFDRTHNDILVSRLFEKVPYLPANYQGAVVRSLDSDSNKHLWVGTNQGVVGLKQVNERFQYNDFWGNDDEVRTIRNYPSLVRYEDGRLWALGGGQLFVFEVNKQTGKYHGTLKQFALNDLVKSRLGVTNLIEISDMLVDRKGDLWLGALNGLFHLRNPLSSEVQLSLYKASYTDPFSLVSNHISSLFEDHTGCLWIGSWGGGVSWIDLERKKFELIAPHFIDERIVLDNTFVRALIVDPDGNIWMGTRTKGINIYHPKTGKYTNIYKNININEKLTSTEIRSLFISGRNIYIGTIDGLNILDLNTGNIRKIGTSVDAKPGLISKSAIFNILTDKEGNIWIATWQDGINKITPQSGGTFSVERFSSSPSSPFVLTSNKVNFLFYDKCKNEILASTSKGLNRLILDDNCDVIDLICYRGYEGAGSFNSEYLWPIVKANDSTYWIGTLGGGLSKFVIENGKRFNNLGKYHAVNYTREDGLPSNDVESLLMDDEGYIWVGGKGLCRFDPRTEDFWNFDVNDGLQSDGFKIGSAYKSATGYFYFGGINGANFFNPGEITRNTIPTQVAITELKVNNNQVDINPDAKAILNRALPYTSSITLNYKENNFSISFASLHFANPQKCKYRYTLKGYDNSWHFVTNDYPVANYSNLNYGTYRFVVDATNNDGIWSDNPKVLEITITPPWWKSRVAFFVYFLLIALIVYLSYYYLGRWIKMRNELKAIEAEEARKEEMHQTKLQFFTNISHEFKTPLTLILTKVEQLLENEISEEEKTKLLRIIRDNAKRLSNLIKELMDFRKAETGKDKVGATKFNFVDFVQGLLDQFSGEINHKDIDFQVECIDREQSEIYSDSAKVAKVVFNLISNALKFTPGGGKIHVRIFRAQRESVGSAYKHVYVIRSDYKASEYLIFQVSDSGVGISSESISQIFDRFFQLKSQENNHLGSGVGLAYVKSLILILKGFIHVSSERNVGTEFSVGFPLGVQHLSDEEMKELMENSMDDVQSIIPDIDQIDDLSGERVEHGEIAEGMETVTQTILIVEDNDDLRNVLKDHFGRTSRVLEAANGLEALEVMKKRIPDIILSDIMMPEMNGLELCKRVREDINLSHIPVVLLTAKSAVENQIEGLEYGADLYVSKPFSMKLLDLQVNKLLETRTLLKQKYAADIFADNRDIAQNQKDKRFLDKFIEFVDQHMSEEDFDVDNLCKELNIGRTNLYKKVKSLTGMPMGAFIRSLRLKKAARILKNEDITITEVLYRIGISSNSYFTKSFKEQFGITPSEFIAQK